MPKSLRHLILLAVAAVFLTACDNATPTPATRPTSIPSATLKAIPATATVPPTPLLTATSVETAGDGPGCAPDRLANSPAAGLGDTLFPDLGNGGYDVRHYDISLDVDVATNVITGEEIVQAAALKPLSAFDLDFRGLTISKLLVNGGNASFKRAGNKLSITPARLLDTGKPFTVEVAYSGEPTQIRQPGSPTEGWSSYSGGVYVAGEPEGASTVYPVNEHPCDKATYTLNVKVPKPYVVAATGRLVGTADQGTETTYTWSTDNPVASYLEGLNIGLFSVDQAQSPGGVKIRSYYPKDLPAAARAAFDRTPEMMQFLSENFGPYPFEAYGVVVADTHLGFALETQTLSLFGSDMGSGLSGEETAVHELAHQWFGDSVSLEQWKDIWLNEGFATYAQWLWVEHTQGEQALTTRLHQMYQAVIDEHGIPPGNPPADDLFDPGVYLRGGLTLQALRVKVGDEAFFNILKTYAARYRHGNATTADFVNVADEVSGRQLDDLFNAWLYNPTMPDVSELIPSAPQATVPVPTAGITR